MTFYGESMISASSVHGKKNKENRKSSYILVRFLEINSLSQDGTVIEFVPNVLFGSIS